MKLKKIILISLFLNLFVNVNSIFANGQEEEVQISKEMKLDVKKEDCTAANCLNFYAGRRDHCIGENSARWDEETESCYCACSNFEEGKPLQRPQMQLNIPLQSTSVTPSVGLVTLLPDTTIKSLDKPLITFSPNVQLLQQQQHLNDPKFLIVRPVIGRLGR